jgi:hypothetical protein
MSETKKEFRGVWIRASLWRRKDLTWFEKCLIAEIDCFANNCFASNAYLAEIMNTTESRLSNALSKLRGMGLIIDAGFNGRVRQILVADNVSSDPKIHNPTEKKIEQGFTQELTQGSPICEGRIHTEVNIDTSIEQSLENTPIIPSKGIVSEFETFYSTYPRKVSKTNAEKAWKKQKCVLSEVMPALQKQMKLWTDPQFIPHPATWLNGRRWEDEVNTKSIPSQQTPYKTQFNANLAQKKRQWYDVCEERGDKQSFKTWVMENRPEEWCEYLPSMDVRWWVEYNNLRESNNNIQCESNNNSAIEF